MNALRTRPSPQPTPGARGAAAKAARTLTEKQYGLRSAAFRMTRPELEREMEVVAVAEAHAKAEMQPEPDAGEAALEALLVDDDELPEILGEDGEDYAEDPEGDVTDASSEPRDPEEYDVEIVEVLVGGRRELDVDVPLLGGATTNPFVGEANALLIRIGQCLARKQKAYLLSGDPMDLEALSQQDVALELGTDESRISEQFGKLVRTPHAGVIPLRDLVRRPFRSKGRRPLLGDFSELVEKVRDAREKLPPGASATEIRKWLEQSRSRSIPRAKKYTAPRSDEQRNENMRREAAANRAIQRAIRALGQGTAGAGAMKRVTKRGAPTSRPGGKAS